MQVMLTRYRIKQDVDKDSAINELSKNERIAITRIHQQRRISGESCHTSSIKSSMIGRRKELMQDSEKSREGMV